MDNKNSKDGSDNKNYLNHLNKLSHKISKPTKRSSSSSATVDLPPIQSQPSNDSHHQPPVYNINKSDFRDVVQRLTGSPVQVRPPPLPLRILNQSKPASSRLQKIRPPPLPQFSNRGPNIFTLSQRQPFSPLPPLPMVHAAAESPISAYMRFYQNSVAHMTSSSSAPANLQPRMVPPTSPLPFGCLSPGVASHAVLFSPTGQSFPQLPLSPTLPLSSPRQKGH